VALAPVADWPVALDAGAAREGRPREFPRMPTDANYLECGLPPFCVRCRTERGSMSA